MTIKCAQNDFSCTLSFDLRENEAEIAKTVSSVITSLFLIDLLAKCTLFAV